MAITTSNPTERDDYYKTTAQAALKLIIDSTAGSATQEELGALAVTLCELEPTNEDFPTPQELTSGFNQLFRLCAKQAARDNNLWSPLFGDKTVLEDLFAITHQHVTDTQPGVLEDELYYYMANNLGYEPVSRETIINIVFRAARDDRQGNLIENGVSQSLVCIEFMRGLLGRVDAMWRYLTQAEQEALVDPFYKLFCKQKPQNFVGYQVALAQALLELRVQVNSDRATKIHPVSLDDVMYLSDRERTNAEEQIRAAVKTYCPPINFTAASNPNDLSRLYY